MDITERQITKIAREVNKFTVQAMKTDGIGTAEFDFIHYVRHHPGTTQAELRSALGIDKGAAFAKVLNILYEKSKKQSRAGFPDVTALAAEEGGQQD